LSSAHSLLALVASAVLFGYLSMRLLISRMAKVILRIFQIMETAMAVSGGALLGGSSTSVTSKPKCSPILVNPRYTGYQVWSRQRTDEVLLDVDNVALGHGTFSGGRRSPRKTSSTRSSARIGTAEHGTSARAPLGATFGQGATGLRSPPRWCLGCRAATAIVRCGRCR